MANVQGFHCNTVIVKNETPCIVQFNTYRKNKTLQKDERKFINHFICYGSPKLL